MPTPDQLNQAISQAVRQTSWPGPVIVIAFLEPKGVEFGAMWTGQPTEGQFLVASEEIGAVGRRQRDLRLNQQLKLSIKEAP